MRRRIVVLGATGRMGQLVAGELTGLDGVLLVARDTAALSRVGEQCSLPVTAAEIDGLTDVLAPGDVLLSLIGPYDLLGDAVVDSAIRSHVTYLDVAAEPAFLERLQGRRGREAARAGVTLLPAVGHASLPGHLVADEVVRATAGDARGVEIAYLADDGRVAGSAAGSGAGRRSLARVLTRQTTTFREGRLRREAVAARQGRFTAGGRTRSTISVGGAEVWSLPGLHRDLGAVDVHTGWFGVLGPVMAATSRATSPLAGPWRRLGADRLLGQVLDQAVSLVPDAQPFPDDPSLPDDPAAQATRGTSHVVGQARDADGTLIARREAVGGTPVVVAARLAAATAGRVAEMDLRDLPVGVVDPISALGRDQVAALCAWAGVVVV